MHVTSPIREKSYAKTRTLRSEQSLFFMRINFQMANFFRSDIVDIAIVQCNSICTAWFSSGIEEIKLQKSAEVKLCI